MIYLIIKWISFILVWNSVTVSVEEEWEILLGGEGLFYGLMGIWGGVFLTIQTLIKAKNKNL